MKQILLTLIIIATLSCKAQSPIVSLKNFKNVEITNDMYCKDLDGDLDNFVGTWKFTNGTTTLTIIFQKKEQVYNDEWYEDILVAEYKYVENAVELVNTLPLIDTFTDFYEHNISGNTIIYPKQFFECDDCTLLERRIKLSFYDPDRTYLRNAMSIRYKNDNGIEKIEMHLNRESGASLVLTDDDARETRVPYGSYTLIKQ